MIICPDNQVDTGNFYINIDGNLIDRVKNFKYLGIEIDANLSWKTHLQSLESEIS